MHFYLYALLLVSSAIHAAPISDRKPSVVAAPSGGSRQAKNLAYYDYNFQPDEYQYQDISGGGGGGGDDDLAANDYIAMALDDSDIGRTLPNRGQLGHKRPPPAAYNSPIYYIRMPPQPYMFVPGLGYISQPPPAPISPHHQFYNVPVNFLANGKPSTIYQWAGGLGGFPEVVQPTPPPPPPPKPPKRHQESTVHRLPGQYAFNGKPEDIFVLRDSYNALYGDALQNFYP